MKKAKWKLKYKYSNGYKFYNCKNKIQIYYNKYRIEGELRVACNGRKTAYIIFRKICINYDNFEFGFSLGKHFEGHNASHKARGWFNYMLNNIPSNCSEYGIRRYNEK